MNVYQKVNELKKTVGGFYKDAGKGKQTGDGLSYQYVTGNQILNAINDKCIELGLIFMLAGTQVIGYQEFHFQNSKGVEKINFIVNGNATFEWVNTDNPEDRITIPFDYFGSQDDISKAYGSALTYSERYCLMKSLGLPTDEDDPDSKDTSDRCVSKASTTKASSKTTSDKKEETTKTSNKNNYAKMLEIIEGTDKTIAWVGEQLKEKFKLGANYVSYNSLDEATFEKYSSYIKSLLIKPDKKSSGFEINESDLPF